MQRFSPKFALRPAAFSACAAAIVCLSGCAGISGTAVSNSLTTSIPKGSLHGGQQPIAGARVYVYAANSTGGYGSASTSLIQNVAGTAQDGAGNFYVSTDGSGYFSYAGTVTCPTPTSQIYILATGGNTTGHRAEASDNTAIALSAALGNCSSVNASTFTSLNEVTTAAMAFALNPFMLNATHIGAPASNTTGLLNAFATIPNLVDNTTGTALAALPGGVGVAPQQNLNTLANIIAPCANSVGATSAACSSLFSHTSSTLGSPSDTIAALLNIAAFPAAQAANLYSDALATAPFQPALTTQPNDYSLGITFNPSISVVQPGAVVIDASGNIWMANCQSCVTPTATDSIVEYSPNGVFLHSYSNAGIHNTKGLALDANSSNIYSINQAVTGSTHTLDQLTKMSTTTGAVQSGFPVTFSTATYGSTNSFQGVAVDNSGEIWATATTSGAVVELDTNGNVINGGPYFVGGAAGIGVDNIGNIWFAGVGGNNLLQFDTNGNFLNNFTPAGLSQPLAIAINGSNEIWSVDNFTNSLSKIEFFNGTNGSGSPYSNLGLYQAAITAIDGSNQVLIPNCRVGCPGSGSVDPDGVIRINQSGAANDGGVNTTATLRVPGLNGVGGIAIDASGNAWLSNSVTGTVTQAIGLASPTIQPIAKASSAGTLGQLP